MSREAAMAIAASNTPATTEAPALENNAALAAVEGEKAPAAPVDDLVSTRIAQIAKKEAKYQAEVEAYKKQLAEFNQNKAKFDPFYERYKQFEEMKAKDPVAAIKLLGFSDTDYINFVAGQEDKSTPEERAEKIAEAKIAAFEKKQQEKEAAALNQRHQETISQFQKSIGNTIKADPEKFELCNFYGEAAEQLIYETVNEGFKQELETNPDAVPMSAAEAAELVEAYYEEHAAKMAALKKLNKQKTEIEAPVAAKKDEPLRAEVKPGMPKKTTLTNNAAPTVAATVKRPESRTEKRERLMAALRAGVRP
jgi:hypothetical protein